MIIASTSSGSAHPISVPVYVYRLYADGHEELIRGVRLRGVNARSMKDILAAGNDENTLDYLENDLPFALLGASASTAEVSVVAPSLLIDDLELTKVDDEQVKLPIVPSPLAANATSASSQDRGAAGQSQDRAARAQSQDRAKRAQ
jgi:hypothetical protein